MLGGIPRKLLELAAITSRVSETEAPKFEVDGAIELQSSLGKDQGKAGRALFSEITAPPPATSHHYAARL